VADEHAAFAAARWRRLLQECRNGVKFIGCDLRHGAQNRLALRHRLHLLVRKIFSTRAYFPFLLPCLSAFAPAPAAWQAQLATWRLCLSLVNWSMVNWSIGQLVNGLWSIGQWSIGQLVYRAHYPVIV
jgi:hypothetical protein